jgi:hypothetical protein
MVTVWKAASAPAASPGRGEYVERPRTAGDRGEAGVTCGGFIEVAGCLQCTASDMEDFKSQRSAPRNAGSRAGNSGEGVCSAIKAFMHPTLIG